MKSNKNYIEEAGFAVTVCKKDGEIIYMNQKSKNTFLKPGDEDLIGKNVLDCHPEPARTLLADLLANPRNNAYTIEKNGIKKLIYQTPWYDKGEYKGFMELSMEIPFNMKHAVRTPKGEADAKPRRKRCSPNSIFELKPNEVFVFGSNLSGSHGGGAARVAYEKFGAVWGEGVGHFGQTYAIPTMQGGVETIKPYVDQFIAYAMQHFELTFLVTRIGCGIAGFKDEDIAPLFKAAMKVDNILLPGSFVKVIENL